MKRKFSITSTLSPTAVEYIADHLTIRLRSRYLISLCCSFDTSWRSCLGCTARLVLVRGWVDVQSKLVSDSLEQGVKSLSHST